MKPSLKLPLWAVAFAGGLAFLSPASAATIAVDDWYAINNTPGASASVAGGDTAAPVFTNVASATNVMVFSYFDQVALASGDTLSLTFDLTLDLATAGATKQFEVLSFGLYNSSATKATTSNYGSDRTTTTTGAGSTITGWGGIMLHKPGRFATHHLRAYQKISGSSSNYAGTGGSVSPYTELSGTAFYSLQFTDDVSRTLTLTLVRTGDDLILNGSMGSTSLFSTTVDDAFLTPGSNLFDAFGFYISQGGTPPDTHVINNATFSNVVLTHNAIPEPSSVVLLVAAGAGAILWRRRKQSA